MASLRLSGKHCKLRALEPSDLDFLYRLENDVDIWEISNTVQPYSKNILERYLQHAHLDIYQAKQLRLCICNNENECLGLVDLFDFDPKNLRAGVGVIVADAAMRNQGFATEALQLVLEYAYDILGLHQIYANILEDNFSSIALFEKLGFEKVGTKVDWVFWRGTFKNELLYQKIKS